MILFKFAKLAIRASFILIFLFLSYEAFNAYKLSQSPPIAIYTNPALYHYRNAKIDLSDYSPTTLENHRYGTYSGEELYAYNYKGTKFLIKNLASKLSTETPPGVKLLVNKGKTSVLTDVDENLEEEIYLVYSTQSDHWLSFLFGKEKQKVSLETIVNEYIPSGKWVAEESYEYPSSDLVNHRKTFLTPFRLTKDSEQFNEFINSFRERKLGVFSDFCSGIYFQPGSKLAIFYNDHRFLIEADNSIFKDQEYIFSVVNCSSPNKWLYELRNGKRYYYGLEVNDPEVTISSFRGTAYTISQVINNEDHFISKFGGGGSVYIGKDFKY